jgi:hypothetical protein
MDPLSFSSGISRPRTKTKGRPRRLSCSSSTATEKPDSYGRLLIELESLKKSLCCFDARELRKLVDHDHPELSVSRHNVLLGLTRLTLYARPHTGAEIDAADHGQA